MSREVLSYAEPSTPPHRETAGVFGNGSYDNVRRVIVVRDGGRIRLAPAPVQWWSWIIIGGFCISLCAVAAVLISDPNNASRLLKAISTVGIGLLTAAFLLTYPALAARWELRRGDRMVIDVERGRLSLPRDGLEFNLADVRALEVASGWTRDARGKRSGDEALGEWHLVVRDADEPSGERLIVVLREKVGTHQKQAGELAGLVPFPVVCVEESVFGGGVTVTP